MLSDWPGLTSIVESGLKRRMLESNRKGVQEGTNLSCELLWNSGMFLITIKNNHRKACRCKNESPNSPVNNNFWLEMKSTYLLLRTQTLQVVRVGTTVTDLSASQVVAPINKLQHRKLFLLQENENNFLLKAILFGVKEP